MVVVVLMVMMMMMVLVAAAAASDVDVLGLLHRLVMVVPNEVVVAAVVGVQVTGQALK